MDFLEFASVAGACVIGLDLTPPTAIGTMAIVDYAMELHAVQIPLGPQSCEFTKLGVNYRANHFFIAHQSPND